MCHQDTKNQVKNEKLSKISSKTGSGFSSIVTASAVGVSSTLVYHIFHKDMHLKQYKFHSWHKLEEKDCDEAYFYLTLPVNYQNNRSKSQPYIWTETLLHYQKILVWCAIFAKRVFGPYYFKDKVNQYNYLEMLKKNSGFKDCWLRNILIFSMVLDLIRLGQYKHG